MGTINKVYILHGWTYSTEKWQPFINLLKQKGVEVNMLKIPGLTEKLDKVWQIDDYVDWLKQTMNPASPQGGQFNNKIILIGHSNGGRIALNFAIKYPDKLSHLILIDSSGIYHNELTLKIKRLVFGSIAKIGAQALCRARLLDRRGRIMRNFSEALRNILYKIVGEGDYKTATPIMKQTMINLINSDRLLNLDMVTVPTLIIWGREDKTTPLSDGKLMGKQIKNSKLYVVDNAKHSPMFTNLEEVSEILNKNI